MEGNGDVGIRKEAENKDLSEMRGVFKAWSEGEHVETCSELSDVAGDCFRVDMVCKAALGNVGDCVIDGGVSERRGGAKIKIRGSTEAACSGKVVRALGGAADRAFDGVTNSWVIGRGRTTGARSEGEFKTLAGSVRVWRICGLPRCCETYFCCPEASVTVVNNVSG